jgi:hypothetical protein
MLCFRVTVAPCFYLLSEFLPIVVVDLSMLWMYDVHRLTLVECNLLPLSYQSSLSSRSIAALR